MQFTKQSSSKSSTNGISWLLNIFSSHKIRPFVKVGIDIVQIPRIEAIWNRYNIKFSKKILHPKEISELNKKDFSNTQIVHYLAKRFSTKEAISKALGVGIGKYLSFQDILIVNDNLGMPNVIIEDNIIQNILIKRYEIYLNEISINISISDDYPIATAIAILNAYEDASNCKKYKSPFLLFK